MWDDALFLFGKIITFGVIYESAMATVKTKTVWFCRSCGNESSKWMGRCPACGEWNTMVEETVATGKKASQVAVSVPGSGRKPMPLSDIDTTKENRISLNNAEVDRILGKKDEMADTEAVTVVDYQVGDAVKITDGPFEGFDGTVEEIVEDRSKLKVMVMIFGRKTLLELNFTQVTKE